MIFFSSPIDEITQQEKNEKHCQVKKKKRKNSIFCTMKNFSKHDEK